MSDALRLMPIAVIVGFLLGTVYTVIYEPTQTAQNAATIVVYKKVSPDAVDSKENPDSDKLIAVDAVSLVEQGFGDVMIDEVVDAVDTSSNAVGHTINAGSKDGYGGLVSIPVGIQSDNKTANGIAFLVIAESAGLGMNVRDTDWYKQFNGKRGEKPTVTRVGDGGLNNDKINAISGVTITSRAVTDSVNTALYLVNNGLNQ